VDQYTQSYRGPMAESQRATIVGQVMGLLAFSMLFTAGGAVLGRMLGPGGMILSIVGSLGTLLVLMFARSKLSAGVALGLFYAFSVFEGMALGLIIESYIARGLGSVVLNAAVTTAGLTMALGAYAWTTKRDLTGMAPYLMGGLFAVIIAGLVGIFFQSSMFHFILAVVTAVLFSGFVMFDLQRLKNANAMTDDAIMLAVSIYLSIFNLFLAILRIFGFLSSSDE
jgi:FtsH-binding integral membrane protein